MNLCTASATEKRGRYILFNHIFEINENFMFNLLNDVKQGEEKIGLLSEIFSLIVLTGKETIQKKQQFICDTVCKDTTYPPYSFGF